MNRPMGGRRPPSDGGVQWPKALLLIFVLVVVGVVILAKTHSTPAGRTSTSSGSGSHHGTTTTSTLPAATTTTTPLLPASQVKVQVLNGVLTGSLAGEWSAKLKTQFGYITEPADDATTKVPTSIIYVLTPGYLPEAQRLATSVGLTASAVYPTVPAPASAPIRTSERATANLVLIIGPDLAANA